MPQARDLPGPLGHQVRMQNPRTSAQHVGLYCSTVTMGRFPEAHTPLLHTQIFTVMSTGSVLFPLVNTQLS